MAKTITIQDNGYFTISELLTDEEKLILGNFLFDGESTDNQGQVIFYTGITAPPQKECPANCDHKNTQCALSCYDDNEPYSAAPDTEREDFCRGT